VNKDGKTVTSFVQVSRGISFSYDPTKPISSRLISLNISDPSTFDTTPLLSVTPIDLTKTYTIVTIDFLATGGDSILAARTGFATLDALEDVFDKYLEGTQEVPLQPGVNGRISTV